MSLRLSPLGLVLILKWFRSLPRVRAWLPRSWQRGGDLDLKRRGVRRLAAHVHKGKDLAPATQKMVATAFSEVLGSMGYLYGSSTVKVPGAPSGQPECDASLSSTSLYLLNG